MKGITVFKFGFNCLCLTTQVTRVHVETHSSYVEKLAELLSENSAILYLNEKMTY